MAWFRKSQLDPLAVTMAGVKLGDRLLVMGTADTALIAALAGKAGLTGRACALDASESATTSAARLIEREGALVETYTAPWAMLPFGVLVVRLVTTPLTADATVAAADLLRSLERGGAWPARRDESSSVV